MLLIIKVFQYAGNKNICHNLLRITLILRLIRTCSSCPDLNGRQPETSSCPSHIPGRMEFLQPTPSHHHRKTTSEHAVIMWGHPRNKFLSHETTRDETVKKHLVYAPQFREECPVCTHATKGLRRPPLIKTILNPNKTPL